MPTSNQIQTFGELLVGIRDKPNAGDPTDEMKRVFAWIVDHLLNVQNITHGPVKTLAITTAMNEAVQACQSAVLAVTLLDDKENDKEKDEHGEKGLHQGDDI